MDVKKCEDQRHADVYAALCLMEVRGARIVVNLYGDLIYSRKRMKDIHIFRGKLHFLLVQDIEVFHSHIIFFIEETFLLDTGHVQDVKFRKGVLQTYHFFIGNIVPVKYVMAYIFRKAELLRGDQDEPDPFVSYQCVDQRVDGASEFQVAAKTDGHVVASDAGVRRRPH